MKRVTRNFPRTTGLSSAKILEHTRSHGGVSIKFEIAYFRTLALEDLAPVRSGKNLRPLSCRRETLGGGTHNLRRLYVPLPAAGSRPPPTWRVQIHTAVGTGDFYSVTGQRLQS